MKPAVSLLLVTAFSLLAAPVWGQANPAACTADIVNATAALTEAGIKIANSTTDCNAGPDQDLDACEEDVEVIVDYITEASDAITDAVVDCGTGNETACGDDIGAILDDLGKATIAITDAVIDCQEPGKTAKCTVDIVDATAALTQCGLDIARAVADC
jgi:hypothetical protein